MALPADWEYEIREPETENGSFSIAFRPAGEEGWVCVQYHAEGFAVCGTGLKTQALVLNTDKYEATTGYYDDSDIWSHIHFSAPFDNYAVVNEGANWLTIYYEDIVMRILRTLTLR